MKRAYLFNTGCITRACKMTDKVPAEVIKRRAEEMNKNYGA